MAALTVSFDGFVESLDGIFETPGAIERRSQGVEIWVVVGSGGNGFFRQLKRPSDVRHCIWTADAEPCDVVGDVRVSVLAKFLQQGLTGFAVAGYIPGPSKDNRVPTRLGRLGSRVFALGQIIGGLAPLLLLGVN